MPEAQKEKLVAQYEKKAIDAYSRIITRYPATDRVGDAKRRLEALKGPNTTAYGGSIGGEQSGRIQPGESRSW